MNPFLQQLNTQTLLADGAMGTMLYSRGISMTQCLEQLVLDRPEWVMEIHAAYANAGADVITTHTFGANRSRLAHFGLEGSVAELNAAAVRLARGVCQEVYQETGRTVYVAGNVGPVGKRIVWNDPRSRVDIAEAFREQIAVLSGEGVDLLLFETFSDVAELEVAVHVAREICDLPLVASMSYGADGLTLAGQDAGAVTTTLLAAGVDIVGVNCSVGPAQVLAVLQAMQRAAPAGIFSAMPNAGLPQQVGNQLHYPIGPEEFAGYVPQLVNSGARLVGGCCGTTPQHTAAACGALQLLDF